MEIIKFLFLFIILNVNIFAEEVPTCREHENVKIRANQIEHLFNDAGTDKIGEKEVRGYLPRDWSNLTGEIKEVFYIQNDPQFAADRVEISYLKKDAKKLTYKMIKKLVRVEGSVFKIEGYSFTDGIRNKSLRPAVQTYIFKNGTKNICQIKVNHSHAIEY